MTATRRLVWTAVLFGVALVCVGLASATHSVIPLFVAWAPLLAVPWMLTRPTVDATPGAAGGDASPEEPERSEP